MHHYDNKVYLIIAFNKNEEMKQKYIRKIRASRWVLILASSALGSCHGAADAEAERRPMKKEGDYIRAIPGEDELISDEIIQQGKVLISYADCYICHREETKVSGPAFSSIALRYPRNDVFISILAQRVILGGTGAWGNSVMSPHPNLSDEDARAMVSYILSVEQR